MKDEALVALVRRAEETHSHALVVWRGDERVGEWSFGEGEGEGRIETMSCPKSVVGLAFGALLDDGQVTSLEQPVYDFFPEWNQGRKKQITIRHLLNHTSGLQDEPNAGIEIEPSPDVVRLALAAELIDVPGTTFRYNNKAVNLLSGIAERACGERLDRSMRHRVFDPIGIGEFEWLSDPAGTPYGMAGLRLRAKDLARLGRLMLRGGEWGGERILGGEYISESVHAGQPYHATCGLLWWLIPRFQRYFVDEAKLAALEATGAPDSVVRAMRPLVGAVLDDGVAYRAALAEALGPDWIRIMNEEIRSKGIDPANTTTGDIVGYYAQGWLGQYLVILPGPEIVAVRLVGRTPAYNDATDRFGDFVDRVRALG